MQKNGVFSMMYKADSLYIVKTISILSQVPALVPASIEKSPEPTEKVEVMLEALVIVMLEMEPRSVTFEILPSFFFI